MKKLVALIVCAAIIGTALSWLHRPGRKSSSDPAEASSPATSAKKQEPAGSESAESAGATNDSNDGTEADTASQSDDSSDSTDSSGGQEKEAATEAPSSSGSTDSQSDSQSEDEGLLARGKKLLSSGKTLEARRVLTRAYRRKKGETRKQARKLLDSINADLVFNPRVKKGATVHRVKSGQTLVEIARQYDVNWRMLVLINDIEKPGQLQVGQKLKILTGTPRIVVDKSEFSLTLYLDDYYVKEYEIGIGKSGKTPTGAFTVETMLKKPTWYRPDGGVVEYGEKGHLLGDRWMGFKDKPHASGYGIHGTNDPSSIGTKCSSGCIRMRNEDVKELFRFVVDGTKVTIKE